MKTHYIALAVLGCFFFAGCATAPLKMETDGPKLAEIVGIHPSELKFISYCGFVETTREEATSPEYYPISATERIVLLTDTDLYILIDGVRTASAKDEIRVPLSELSGVTLTFNKNLRGDLVAYQLQFLRGEHVLVVQIAFSGPDEMRLEEAQRPFDLVLAAGVPKWDSEKFFLLVLPTRLDAKTACATVLGVTLVILIDILIQALIMAPLIVL
jgi:hypothetical protein